MSSLIDKATFGMGCFWFAEALFGATQGVVTTKVGYSGGTSSEPNYYAISDHIETVEITFDTQQTTFEKLLKLFWLNHDPTSKQYKRQYTSAILYHSEEQKRLAELTMKQEQMKYQSPILTELIPASRFYDAEDYHQKYHLRQNVKLFQTLNSNNQDLIDSPLAAKLNGYVCGIKCLTEFEEEAKSFTLTPFQLEYIKDKIKAGVKPYC